MQNPLTPKAQINVFGVDKTPMVYGLMFDCVVPDIVGTIEVAIEQHKLGTLRQVESRPNRYELVVSTCYDIDDIVNWLESLGDLNE